MNSSFIMIISSVVWWKREEEFFIKDKDLDFDLDLLKYRPLFKRHKGDALTKEDVPKYVCMTDPGAWKSGLKV